MSLDLSSASNGIRDYLVKQNCQESFVSVTFEPEDTFSTRLQQSIDRAYEVTDEIIVYIPGGKFNEETIDETFEKYRIKGIVAVGFFGSYMIFKPGNIHQRAVYKLGRMLIEVDRDMASYHEGPEMVPCKLHMPEHSTNRWYQAVHRESRLQDTLSPDELRSNEGDKSKQPGGGMWPCYLELIRKIQGCPFFPTYINETAVTQTSEYLLNVGMHWVGATGLLVDTVILQDIKKGHEGSDLESLTIHHLDCSASNLRRLVWKHRGTNDHGVLSWACRVKCKRGIECMGALKRVVDMMSDYDQALGSATALNDRKRIDLQYTDRLKLLVSNLSEIFAALPGAQLLRLWRVTDATGRPNDLLEDCYRLFSRFKESGIVKRVLFLIDDTEMYYRELLGGADLLPIGNAFGEEEGIRQVTEILFSERQEIKISSRYIPYQRPQIHVEQILPGGVEEPVLAVPSTSIHGFITDSGASSQVGRDSLTKLFRELSKVADPQIAAEWQPVTVQVSRENVRDDYLWEFVANVLGPSDDMETDLNHLFARGPIWARIPLLYLTTRFIRQTCLRQDLGLRENSSRSVMVQRLALELATPDEGREVSFTMNNISLHWVNRAYRPKYERRLLHARGARNIATLREQDSIAVRTHFYEIEDEGLPLLCRELGGTPPSENHTRKHLIRSILALPPHNPLGDQYNATTRTTVPRIISARVNKSKLTSQQKSRLLNRFEENYFREVIQDISNSEQSLQGLELALNRVPKSLARIENPEDLLELIIAFTSEK